MTIPKSLISSIQEKQVALFLGAGFIYNAKSKSGKKPPMGNELGKLIAGKFLTGNFDSYPLQYIADLAISESSLFKVQEYIRSILADFGPNETHLKFTEFYWRAIFTTNYDQVLEAAYKISQKSKQELSPVTRNTPESQIFTSQESLPYYKLHGCISQINDETTPLILGTDQYISGNSNRNRLFLKLEEHAASYPILYIGYSNQDMNIRSILNKIASDIPSRPRSYMVIPGAKEEEIRYWESQKITIINMGWEEFVKQLDIEIPVNTRRLQSLIPKEDNPIFLKFVAQDAKGLMTASLERFLNDEVEFVNRGIRSKSIPAKEFYKGHFEGWDPIIKDYDISRKELAKIEQAILLEEKYTSPDRPHLFVVHGYAGSGKSVLLKRLAWECSNSFEKICLFLLPNVDIRIDPLIELYRYVKERIYFFVDNVAKHQYGIIQLMNTAEREGVPISIVSSERTNIWNSEDILRNRVSDEFVIGYLAEEEIKRLIEKLSIHRSLGYLENLSDLEKIKEFEERAGRVLLVALYEATNGKPLEDIILDEYDQIGSAEAKSLYLTVAILHRIGSEARAGLISRIHGISLKDFKIRLFSPLEYIIFDRQDHLLGDYVYTTRHQYIAQILFERVLASEQDKFDEYLRILTYLDVDYVNDRNAFLFLTNARKLHETFKDPKRVRLLFDAAMEQNGDDAKLLQQMAIFEMISSDGSLSLAEKHINLAIAKDAGDHRLKHTLAELALRKADQSIHSIEKDMLIEKAQKICYDLIKKKGDSIYSYHTILKALFMKVEQSFKGNEDRSIEKAIKEFEKIYNDFSQQYPNEQFFLEIEAKFRLLCKDKPQAIRILGNAHHVNPATPFIALRYSKILESVGEFSKAADAIKKTLETNPGDRDINFRYAQLLELSNNNQIQSIEHHYRRSFTKGDSRYEAQFHYARILYVGGKYKESKLLFDELRYAKVSPDQKKSPRKPILENGVPRFFNCKVVKVEERYATVKVESINELINLQSGNFDRKIWVGIQLGVSIKMEISFNYYGPIGTNITILR